MDFLILELNKTLIYIVFKNSSKKNTKTREDNIPDNCQCSLRSGFLKKSQPKR
jgi:hypothetical protein